MNVSVRTVAVLAAAAALRGRRAGAREGWRDGRREEGVSYKADDG